uniref:Uncharacterized protein n=1 Tax=Brandeis virus TaxID=2169477 RepID=A0A2R4SV58_9VIRU|nr:hypothetical protein [Brandeis virus]
MTEYVIETSRSPPQRTGLFQAMFDSYSVLVNHPYAFFVFIIAMLSVLAESNSSYGPLELLSNALLNYCNSNGRFVPLAKLMLVFVHWIIPIKMNFFMAVLFLIPAIIKSDLGTWMLSFAFVGLAIFTTIPYYQMFLFSQFYYMYCFVSSSLYKAIILSVSFIVLILGFDHFSSMAGLS